MESGGRLFKSGCFFCDDQIQPVNFFILFIDGFLNTASASILFLERLHLSKKLLFLRTKQLDLLILAIDEFSKLPYLNLKTTYPFLWSFHGYSNLNIYLFSDLPLKLAFQGSFLLLRSLPFNSPLTVLVIELGDLFLSPLVVFASHFQLIENSFVLGLESLETHGMNVAFLLLLKF